MLRYTVLFLLVFAIAVFFATDAMAQDSPLRGKVIWASGAPAIGLEVKVQVNSSVLATAFTNENGLYAFFESSLPRRDFTIVIADRNRVLKEVTVAGPEGDGTIPVIILE
ncbi:MAG: hypothetical protein ACYC9M_01705 [Desulfobulbaceae bacterium]